MTTIQGSPQQEAIWDAITDGGAHVVADARAGVGKTFTLVGALDRVAGQGLRCAFVAYNRHIAKALAGLVPAGVAVSTLHSLGYAALRRSVPRLGQPDDRKLWDLSRRLGNTLHGPYRKGAVDLARMAKYTRTDPTDLDGLLRLANRYGIDLSPTRGPMLELASQLVIESRKSTGTIDFDDMIDLPIHLDLPVDTYDLLMVDEAQDLSPLQQALAFRANRGGRMVLCGDRFQACYGFAGSDPQSLPNMHRDLAASFLGAESFPLTVTRRCPSSHVALAQVLVPDLEAMPDAPEGEIEEVSPEAIAIQAQPGDMVIARCNAPVVAVAFGLIRRGVQVIVRGREVGKGLLGLIERLEPDGLRDLARKLGHYKLSELERLEAEDAPPDAILAVTDRCDCLSCLMQGCRSLEDLQQRVEKLFVESDSAPTDAVICSSVHRAKGLEARTVFIAAPEMMPHAKAERPWEAQQERNIAYVAVTRSKNRLVFGGKIPSLFRRNGQPQLPLTTVPEMPRVTGTDAATAPVGAPEGDPAQADRAAEPEPAGAAAPIAEKADYVRSQGQTREHHCHWPGCQEQVPPAQWGCKTHWFRLPKSLRDRIWATYRPGQEKDWTPSREYLAAAQAVQEWIRGQEESGSKRGPNRGPVNEGERTPSPGSAGAILEPTGNEPGHPSLPGPETGQSQTPSATDPAEQLRLAGFRRIAAKGSTLEMYQRNGTLCTQERALHLAATEPCPYPVVFCPNSHCRQPLDAKRTCWKCSISLCACGAVIDSPLCKSCRACEVAEARKNGEMI